MICRFRKSRRRQETARTQTPQELVDLFFPAEEEVIFVGLKRAQAGKGLKSEPEGINCGLLH